MAVVARLPPQIKSILLITSLIQDLQNWIKMGLSNIS